MSSVIGILDCAVENQRLELWLETEETSCLVLRLATYSDGLGWQTQKSIPIDQKQAQQMQFLLAGANHLLNQATNSQPTVAAPINAKPSRVAAIAPFPLAARKSA